MSEISPAQSPEKRQMLASRWRLLAIIAGALLALVLAAFLAVAWYYAGRIDSGALSPDYEPKKLDLRVIAVGDGKIDLAPTADAEEDGSWTKDGLWGIEWPGGYARAGRIIELNDEHVVREFSPTWGQPRPGDLVRLDSFAFPHDPQIALGLTYPEVALQSPLGHFPAWLAPGSDATWIIAVHGRGSDRAEVLRLMPALARLGHPVLAITYRNDAGLPASSDGRHGFGKSEWTTSSSRPAKQ